MLHYANVSDMVLGRKPEGGMVLQQPKVRQCNSVRYEVKGICLVFLLFAKSLPSQEG